MNKDKILAALTLLIGGIGAVLSLMTAFGVNITPDQHTAIVAVASLVLMVAGAWFHPSIPVGNKGTTP